MTDGHPIMRKLFSLVVLSGIAACGGKPISFFALTPQPSPDAYTCVLRKVNELGYTVTNTNKEAGFVTADKQTTGAIAKTLLGKEDHEQLTVSVFDDATAQRRTIRVTAAATSARSTLSSTQTSAKSPSDVAIADANAVLAACSEGVITRQARTKASIDSLSMRGL